MTRFCQRCRAQLNEGDHFCGNCGASTRLGVKQQGKIEKVNLTLSQLERSYQAGQIPEEKYEKQRKRYDEELEKLNDELNAKRPTISQGTNTDPNQTTKEPTVDGVKTSVIYADPPHRHLHDAVGYLLATAIIVGVSLWLTWSFIGEGFENAWLDQWYLLAFSLVGPGIYLFWMWRADKFEREPLYFVVLIFGWGVVASLLSLIGNNILDIVGLGMAWFGPPIVEETMKGIGVYLMAKNPEFNDQLDGIVYGFASGMGFAWAENFFYIIVHYEGDLIWSLLRVFIFSLGHGLYTAYMGWALGRAKVKNGYVTLGDLRLGLVMAIVAHAIYNSDLIQVDSYSSLGLWVVMTLGVFTLILYALVRNSWAEEKKWHYDDGYAPKGRARAS